MLWLVIGDQSHQIVSCNIHIKDGIHQLWVTRAIGEKSLKIAEGDEQEVKLIKEAIDFAIEHGEKALRIS